MLVEERIDAVPRVAQDVRAREVVELARVRHERNEIALAFFQRFIDEAHRVKIRHVDVRRPMQDEERTLEAIDV